MYYAAIEPVDILAIELPLLGFFLIGLLGSVHPFPIGIPELSCIEHVHRLMSIPGSSSVLVAISTRA